MKQLFTLAAAATILAACSINGGLDQTPPTSTERIPLSIGAISPEKTASTRGVLTNVQTDTLNQYTALGLFIVGQGTTSGTNNTAAIPASPQSYEIINYKLGGTTYFTDGDKYGYFTSVTESDGSTTASLYYPDNKSAQIGLFAYAPHTTLTATDATTHTTSFAPAPAASTNLNTSLLTVTPLLNQTANKDYVLSDVLWGVQGYGTENNDITAANYLLAKDGTPKAGFYSGSVAANRGQIVVPMKHALSKVVVNLIVSGMELSKLQGATVKIYVDYKTGTMNLATGTVTAGSKETNPVAVTLTNHLGLDKAGGTEITAGNDGHPNNISYASGTYAGYSASAVIIPQTVHASATDKKAFIEITLADGSTKYVYAGKDINLATAGQKYTYNIMVTASGLVVSTTVTNWTAAADIEGPANLQ